MRRLLTDPLTYIVLSGFALLILIGWLAYNAEKRWEAFKTDHNCKMVSRISGDVFNTFNVGSNGQVSVGIGSTSDKTGWLCDDGVTYYR